MFLASPRAARTDSDQLALLAAGGDREALGRLYEMHCDQLYRFVFMRVRDHSIAEEICSNVWLRVTRAIRNFEPTPRAHCTSWLYAITRNMIADHYRSTARSKETPTEDMLALSSTHIDSHEGAVATAADVTAALDKLSQKAARLVTLRYFVGLSVEETADVMKMSYNATKSLQHRALKQMRHTMSTTLESVATEPPAPTTITTVNTPVAMAMPATEGAA